MSSLKTLNPYFYKHKKLMSLGVIFVILSNFFSIFYIKYIGQAIDILSEILKSDGLTKSQDSEIWKNLLLYVAIIVICPIISGVLKFFMRQTLIVTSRRIEFELKNNIYHQYQKLSFSFLKKSKVGDLMNRISEDVVNVRQYLGPGIMYTINLITLLIITLFYMLKTDMWLTLYSLAPLPILSFIIYMLSSSINKKTKIVQESQSNISSFVQDTFSGIRVIKAFVKEKYIAKKYEDKTTDYRKKSLSLAYTDAFFNPLMILVVGLCNVFILYVGGQRFIEGKISIGVIAEFFIYLNNLIFPFMALGWVTSINRRAEASMERINEFLEEEDEIKNTNHKIYPIEGNIRFENVSYTYPNTGIKALKNISFEVHAKQTVAFMGKTGSGKSTIGLLLCRLIEPDEGTIFIDNIPLKNHNLELIRKNMGYVPQENFLFSDSIFNNISYGIENPTLEQVEKFSQLAEIHSNIIDFSEGYETEVGERGVTLSGGQKQRVSIARALMINPHIFIFDDSLSAIDTETEEKILKNIQKEIQKKTTIIITHRISSSKKADKIIVLEEGAILECGTHKELIALKNNYFEMFNKQIVDKILEE